ncbi:unnamed protein product, partial [Didymodactylos carnosus]
KEYDIEELVLTQDELEQQRLIDRLEQSQDEEQQRQREDMEQWEREEFNVLQRLFMVQQDTHEELRQVDTTTEIQSQTSQTAKSIDQSEQPSLPAYQTHPTPPSETLE